MDWALGTDIVITTRKLPLKQTKHMKTKQTNKNTTKKKKEKKKKKRKTLSVRFERRNVQCLVKAAGQVQWQEKILIVAFQTRKTHKQKGECC